VKPWIPIASIAALGLAAPSAPLAQVLDKAGYLAARKTIESDFRTAKTGCEPMLGNVRTICIADVRGRELIALAELRAAYDPTSDAVVEVRIAKARAALAVARMRCDELLAHRKAECMADAEAAHAAALAPPSAAAPK
jgi:hypothetical protein